MPIYEYACPKCHHEFEEWGKASESHKEEACPVCGTKSPRVISRTSFVLKGDGWYVSDYGYRKGITEDGGASGSVPAKAEPITPAKQTDKTIAKTAVEKAPAASSTAAASESKTTAAPAAKTESSPGK